MSSEAASEVNTAVDVGARQESFDLLLTGGTVITVDQSRRVIDDGAVGIRGNRIVAVGSATELAGARAARTVDCRNKVVIPGMVDLHDHLFQHLLRGLGEDIPVLNDWLGKFMIPASTALTPEIVRAGGMLGSMLAARSGVTCVVDHHYGDESLEAIAALGSAMQETGIRGVIARTIWGPRSGIAEAAGVGQFFNTTIDEEIAATAAAMDLFDSESMVAVWPAPDHIPYNTQDMVRASVALARDRGTGWYAHCSEAEWDVANYLENYRTRPVDWLYDEGLLQPRTILAHCNWLSDGEIERLGDSGASVAHNPSSNSFGLTGVCPVRDLRDAGTLVGLGVDGNAIMGFDMFEEMRLAVQIQKMTRITMAGLDDALLEEEAIQMATLEGALSVGLDAGAIEVGKLADIAVVDFSNPWLSPSYATALMLVHVARASDVTMTIVDGRIVYEDGIYPLLHDQDAVIADVHARSAELLSRAGIQPSPNQWRVPDVPTHQEKGPTSDIQQ